MIFPVLWCFLCMFGLVWCVVLCCAAFASFFAGQAVLCCMLLFLFCLFLLCRVLCVVLCCWLLCMLAGFVLLFSMYFVFVYWVSFLC